MSLQFSESSAAARSQRWYLGTLWWCWLFLYTWIGSEKAVRTLRHMQWEPPDDVYAKLHGRRAAILPCVCGLHLHHAHLHLALLPHIAHLQPAPVAQGHPAICPAQWHQSAGTLSVPTSDTLPLQGAVAAEQSDVCSLRDSDLLIPIDQVAWGGEPLLHKGCLNGG